MRQVTVSAIFVGAIVGCQKEPADTQPPEPAPLIDVAAWAFTSAASDPLPDHRPAVVDCGEASWGEELGGIEVDTTLCNYFSVSQPLLMAARQGEPLQLLVWHQNLFAEVAAEAHVAVLIDGAALWERALPLPADAAAYDEVIPAPADLAAGAAVTFHVHNHGSNTYNFNQLEVLR